jgi:hypothetical protein
MRHLPAMVVRMSGFLHGVSAGLVVIQGCVPSGAVGFEVLAMSGNLLAGLTEAEIDLERRRIALKTAAELHDARDLSGLMATASNLYGWLVQPSRRILAQAQRPGARSPALGA